MACVYILYSKTLDRYYTGSCLDLESRLKDHKEGKYFSSFTSKAKDWGVFLSIEDLNYNQARKIEFHIKRMKSRKYIQNLLKYPEIIKRLRSNYP